MKPKKSKGVGFYATLPLAVFFWIPPEGEYSGFLIGNFQVELCQPGIKRLIECPSVLLILEAAGELCSPEELHPQALSEPDLNLLAHPVPLSSRRINPHLPVYEQSRFTPVNLSKPASCPPLMVFISCTFFAFSVLVPSV